jgi:hypothetical protein
MSLVSRIFLLFCSKEFFFHKFQRLLRQQRVPCLLLLLLRLLFSSAPRRCGAGGVYWSMPRAAEAQRFRLAQNSLKISLPKVISRVLTDNFHKINIASVSGHSGCFIFKICQTVADIKYNESISRFLRISFLAGFCYLALLCAAAAVVLAAAACCSKLLLFQHRHGPMKEMIRILLAKTLISIRLVSVKFKAT